MNYSHVKRSYSMSNTDDIFHASMESKDHLKARSTGTHDYESMGDSIDSYLHKRLDPALALPYSSSDVSHNSSPRKKASLSSPKKTSALKLCRKSEPRKGGVLIYDVKSSSSEFCNNRRGAGRHNHSGSFCSTEGEKLGLVGEGMEMQEEAGVECSMCGDVGIAELLFLCSKCSLRPQHTYCGRSYPNVSEEASICNWCLHEQDSSTSSVVEDQPQNPAPACVINEGYTDEALVEKVGSHGKAFDYLLLVAAQSDLPQLINEATDEIKQTKQTASVNNITDSKIMASSAHKKAMGDSDKKARMGYTESHGSVARITSNDRERSMTGLVKKLNMEIQSAVNIKAEERGNHGGAVYAGENMPKRQRCSKGLNHEPALKCRKRGLQLSPARSNYRRYKLLADVVR